MIINLEAYQYQVAMIDEIRDIWPDEHLCVWNQLCSYLSCLLRYQVKKTVVHQQLLPVSCSTPQMTQTRGRYIDWRMRRDVKRRQLVKENHQMVIRLNAVRRNSLMPREIQDIALNDLWALPRDSHWTRLVNRCVLTSRPRGVVHPHRLSRLVWRHCADYNKLSGVMRAKW